MPPTSNPAMVNPMPNQVERPTHVSQQQAFMQTIANSMGSREALNSLPIERNDRVMHTVNSDSLVGVGGDVRNAFGGSGGGGGAPNINMGKMKFCCSK